MNKMLNIGIMTLVFLVMTTLVVAEPIGISNCVELQAMNNNLSADYILLNDIDCSDTINWNDGSGFRPVGHYDIDWNEFPFTGTLNGQGYTISSVYTNWNNTDAVFISGLFGWAKDSSISNVNLDYFNITQHHPDWGDVGFLIGESNGVNISNVSITNSYAKASGWVGTFIGFGGGGGTKIYDSYGTNNTLVSDGTQTMNYVVNLADLNFFGAISGGSIIQNSYLAEIYYVLLNRTGTVKPFSVLTSINNSYFDCETLFLNDVALSCEQNYSKTIVEMQTLSTFTGWDMALSSEFTTETWYIDEGNDYPRLWFEPQPEEEDIVVPVSSGGNGGGRYIPPTDTTETPSTTQPITQKTRNIGLTSIITSILIIIGLWIGYNNYALSDLRRTTRIRKYKIISTIIIILLLVWVFITNNLFGL